MTELRKLGSSSFLSPRGCEGSCLTLAWFTDSNGSRSLNCTYTQRNLDLSRSRAGHKKRGLTRSGLASQNTDAPPLIGDCLQTLFQDLLSLQLSKDIGVFAAE